MTLVGSRRLEYIPLVLVWFVFIPVALTLLWRFLGAFSWRSQIEDIGGRVVSCDVLRFLALLAVVYYHVGCNTIPHFEKDGFNFGVLGVSLFIILSGVALSIRTLPAYDGFGTFFRKRLRTILPSYLFSAFVIVLFLCAFTRWQTLRGDVLRTAEFLLGMSGYLNMPRTYFTVGDWYVGFIILLYVFAPFVYRGVRRFAIATLLGLLVLAAVCSFGPVPAFFERIGFGVPPSHWPLTRLIELACGMAFWLYIRGNIRWYRLAALVSLAVVLLGAVFCPINFLARYRLFLGADCVAVFILLMFILDSFRFSAAGVEIFSFLGKYSFLAFLYHHRILYLLYPAGVARSMSTMGYQTFMILLVSYFLAWLSLRPAELLGRLLFKSEPPRKTP